MRNRLALAALLIAGLLPHAGGTENLAPAAQRVAQAVALVTSPTVGTAFAIRTSAGNTLFLTAAHVVGCKSGGGGCSTWVNLQLDGVPGVKHDARVVAHGDVDGSDLALLSLGEGPRPIVALAGHVPQRGDALAVVGFPENVVQSTNGDVTTTIDATLALGTFASDGASGLFEFSGASYHGDSGGPIFNPATGEVFGVVHGQSRTTLRYQGFGAGAIGAFIKPIDIAAAVAAAPASPGPARSIPPSLGDCARPMYSQDAATCYGVLADRGNAHAAYLAAAEYLRATYSASPDTAKYEALGAHYLQLAANARDIDAEILLGRDISLGIPPFARDVAVARLWQQRAWDDAVKAAAAGDLHAAYLKALQRTTSDNPNVAGLSFDPVLAKKEFQACAERGSAECARALGQSPKP